MAKRRITQETFDAAVRENMEEFEMDPDEALREAVEQFESQGNELEEQWLVADERTVYVVDCEG